MLIDFGISRKENYTLHTLKTTGTGQITMGTLRWMAYEHATAIGDLSDNDTDQNTPLIITHTPETDMWAFGMVVFVRISLVFFSGVFFKLAK